MVVFTDDPSEARRLLATGSEYSVPLPPNPERGDRRVPLIAAHRPREFEALFPRASEGVAFLHELTSPAGVHRLVVVPITVRASHGPHLGYNALIDGVLALPARSWRPIPLPPLHSPHVFGLSQEYADTGFRVFAGRVDPSDASHFTIAYLVQRKHEGTWHPRVIDGWLRDDGKVTLKLTLGSAVTHEEPTN